MSKVFMMMSGGVDSSVAAACLKDEGHEVVGVFMKCWSIDQLESMGASQDLYGCFWEDDANDARQVADKLNIPFYVWDFQQEYKTKVVDYMLREYKLGRTPNPDVMCNSSIKFGIFYQKAMVLGADFVATGHYASLIDSTSELNNFKTVNTINETDLPLIARANDKNKDQSYFIWQIKQDQIKHTLFPIGKFSQKSEVRAKAEELGLITARKPDSQGLCFIGQTPLRELLLQTLGEKKGFIKKPNGDILGNHPGAYLYTIGQRFGLGLSGGPWFVSKIDVDANEVIVSHESNQSNLYSKSLTATNLNWHILNLNLDNVKCEAQIRYRQNPESCTLTELDQNRINITFDNPVRAISKGQSIVFYDDGLMLGGGIIDSVT